MRIIVTGSAGFIGSVTVDILRDHGHDVIGIDDFSTGFHRDTTTHDFDLRNNTFYLAWQQEWSGVDAIIHLAGKTLVGESPSLPLTYLYENITTLTNAIYLARQLNTKRFVFASSANVYGPNRTIGNNTPYGLSKRWGEQMLEYSKVYGIEPVVFRYFNVTGGTSKRQAQYEPETHLIPLAFQAARGGSPLKLYGTNYHTKDGTAERDYIHVWDVARANMMAACGDIEPGIYDIGTGATHTVREVITAVEQRLGMPVPVEEHPRRPGDPTRLVAWDTHLRLLKSQGWEPTITSLKMILESIA